MSTKKHTPEKDLIQQAVDAILEDENCVDIGSYSDGYINTDAVAEKILPFQNSLASQSSELSKLRELVKRVADLGISTNHNQHQINTIVRDANKLLKMIPEISSH